MDFERDIEKCFAEVPDGAVKEAMLYSLLAGGKRLRPKLLYAVLKGYGSDEACGDSFAFAIEMIHTYSLIHDDLPAMDNDDLRRGKPTCHKKFNEATAVLAGDGLLTFAFQAAASAELVSTIIVKGIRILAEMAGPCGMVFGQECDLFPDQNDNDFAYIEKTEKYKTGCMISAPLMIGALIAGKDDETIAKWHEIGDLIGLAFQMQDDILDVDLSESEFGKSVSDVRNDKSTCVRQLGLQAARNLMNKRYDEAASMINKMNGFDPADLLELIEEMRNRRK